MNPTSFFKKDRLIDPSEQFRKKYMIKGYEGYENQQYGNQSDNHYNRRQEWQQEQKQSGQFDEQEQSSIFPVSQKHQIQSDYKKSQGFRNSKSFKKNILSFDRLQQLNQKERIFHNSLLNKSSSTNNKKNKSNKGSEHNQNIGNNSYENIMMKSSSNKPQTDKSLSKNLPPKDNRNSNHRQLQHISSEESSMMTNNNDFNDYQQILHSLLYLKGQQPNNQNQLQLELNSEWKDVPEIVVLTFKAIKQSLNRIRHDLIDKIQENKCVANDQGLKIMQNQIKIKDMKAQISKNIKQSQKNHEDHNNKSKQKIFIHKNRESISPGLDSTMIEQVKTITQALLHKNHEQFQQSLQQKLIQFENRLKPQLYKSTQTLLNASKQQQSQYLYTTLYTLNKNSAQTIKREIEQNLHKLYSDLKDNGMKIDNIIKQVYAGDKGLQTFGSHIQQRLRRIQSSDKISNRQDKNDRQLIRQILDEKMALLQSNCQSKLGQMRQKLYKDFSDPSRLKGVQNLLVSTQRQYSQRYRLLQARLQLLQNKKQQIKKEKIIKKKIKDKMSEKPRSQSSMTVSIRSRSVSRSSLSPLTNKKSIKPKIVQSKLVRDDQSPFVSKLSRKKTSLQQSSSKITSSSLVTHIQKLYTRKLDSFKQQLDANVSSHISKNFDQLSSRIELSQKQLCSLIQENYVKKASKSENDSSFNDIKRTIAIIAAENVLVRLITNLSCEKNSILKWQKQQLNTLRENFDMISFASRSSRNRRQSSQSSLLLVHSPGLYQLNVVFYSSYLKRIYFQLLVNEECVYTNWPTNVEENETQIAKTKELKTPSNNHSLHPARGVFFTQLLLLPAKSKLSIRMLQKFEMGQGMLQVQRIG